MSALALRIDQPAHGTGLADGAVALRGSLIGDATGLSFKWFSSLNAAASAEHPELNVFDHTAAVLNWSAALAEFGSHALVLVAADRDGIDLASIKAIKRSAMAGGTPPAAPAPCVVHRLVAQLRTPSADGQSLSRASATIEFLAPVRWAKPNPALPGTWIADDDYAKVNGIAFTLRLAPAGPPDPARSADIALDAAALPFFRADDKTWFRRGGALPANLGTGTYVLTLRVTAGAGVATATRTVALGA